MPLQFSTASQESVTNGIKVLVYGGAGVGKTVLTATLPNPVLISAESGSLSLRESNLRRLFGDDPNICYNMPMITIKVTVGLQYHTYAGIWGHGAPELPKHWIGQHQRDWRSCSQQRQETGQDPATSLRDGLEDRTLCEDL